MKKIKEWKSFKIKFQDAQKMQNYVISKYLFRNLTFDSVLELCVRQI